MKRRFLMSLSAEMGDTLGTGVADVEFNEHLSATVAAARKAVIDNPIDSANFMPGGICIDLDVLLNSDDPAVVAAGEAISMQQVVEIDPDLNIPMSNGEDDMRFEMEEIAVYKDSMRVEAYERHSDVRLLTPGHLYFENDGSLKKDQAQ